MFFLKDVLKRFKESLLKKMKKKWFKGAHVAANSMVGPMKFNGYLMSIT
jgi:hypothetical protein